MNSLLEVDLGDLCIDLNVSDSLLNCKSTTLIRDHIEWFIVITWCMKYYQHFSKRVKSPIKTLLYFVQYFLQAKSYNQIFIFLNAWRWCARWCTGFRESHSFWNRGEFDFGSVYVYPVWSSFKVIVYRKQICMYMDFLTY